MGVLQHRLYTWPEFLEGEAHIINELFALGLPCLHLRKPTSSLEEYQALLKEINAAYHPKIILHQHWEVADEFNIQGLHWTEGRRTTETPSNFAYQVADQQAKGYQVGSSIHQPGQLLEMPNSLDYVTVSPVFESISKPNYRASHVWKDSGKYPFLLVGLGGVASDKITELQARGFKAIALLGAIWKPADQAIEKYQELCQRLQQP